MTSRQFCAIRRRLGCTAAAMADQLGVHRRTVSRYEHGSQKIPGIIGYLMLILRDQRA